MITITEIANQLIEIEAKREEYKSLAENIYEFIRSDQQSLVVPVQSRSNIHSLSIYRNRMQSTNCRLLPNGEFSVSGDRFYLGFFMVILEFSFETNSEYEFNYKRYPNLIHPQSDSIIIKISK